MIYKARTDNIAQLLNLPETGMGYQLIEAKIIGERFSKKFVAYNSELIVDNDTSFIQFKSQIINEGFEQSTSKANLIQLSDIKLSKVGGVIPQIFNEALFVKFSRAKSGKSAEESAILYGTGTDKYVRLSAYLKDRRIDVTNAKLLPGAYATTLNDYQACKQSNDNPIDRYALPNDEPIKWAFYIQPSKTDPYKFGIALRNFGKEGGGIEALFINGTSNKTLYATTKY
jgi:hypothetical protein